MLRCERKETMFADEYRLVRFLFYRLAEMSDLTQFSVLFYGVNNFFCVNESYCRLRLRCSYVTIFRFCFVKSNQLSVTNLQQQQQQDMTDDRSFDRSTDNITFA